MIPVNLPHILPRATTSSRYIYNIELNNNNYFFVYVEEFNELHVRINNGVIVVFDCPVTFSSQRSFTDYHIGFFSKEERSDHFLKEVKEKLTI